ncbi:MAG: serine hydrolase [Bacteroidota bacterium]
MKNISIIVLLCLLINTIQGQDIKYTIDSILFLNYNNSAAGASVLVQLEDSVIYENYFGKADLANDIAISSQTIFNIGSVSKQFTVFAILLLEEEGKLSIGDDIRRYIPELPDYGVTITLEQLARHTSGLKNVNFLARMAGWRQTDMSTHQQMLDLLFRQESIDFIPGTAYKYSNAGTMLLAEVVQRVAGIPFSTFMNEHVFQPLGMKNSFVRDEVGMVIKNEAHGYYWEHEKMNKAINAFSNIGYTNVYSTVFDLSLWASNFRTPKVGNKKVIGKMLSPTILHDGRVVEHAMGLFNTPHHATYQIQHSGSHRAYLAYFGMFPEYGLDIIICSNVSNFDLFGTVDEVAKLFVKGEPKSEIRPRPEWVSLSEDQMNKFNGHYWLEAEKISRKIFTRNDTLVYSSGNGKESYYRPINKYTFCSLDNNSTLKFEEDKCYFIDQNEASELVKYIPVKLQPEALENYAGTYYSYELNASYELVIEHDKLIAKSPKMKPIIFTPIMENVFTSNQWFLNGIKFKANGNNLEGFYASNVQVSNIWFKKIG